MENRERSRVRPAQPGIHAFRRPNVFAGKVEMLRLSFGKLNTILQTHRPAFGRPQGDRDTGRKSVEEWSIVSEKGSEGKWG